MLRCYASFCVHQVDNFHNTSDIRQTDVAMQSLEFSCHQTSQIPLWGYHKVITQLNRSQCNYKPYQQEQVVKRVNYRNQKVITDWNTREASKPHMTVWTTLQIRLLAWPKFHIHPNTCFKWYGNIDFVNLNDAIQRFNDLHQYWIRGHCWCGNKQFQANNC